MVAKVIKNQIEKFEYREKNIVRVLFSAFVLLLISYGFFVNGAIMNSVRTEQVEKDLSTLNSSINSMEFDYLNAKNAITMDLATSMGFVEVKNQKFLAMRPVSNNLSLSTNENR